VLILEPVKNPDIEPGENGKKETELMKKRVVAGEF